MSSALRGPGLVVLAVIAAAGGFAGYRLWQSRQSDSLTVASAPGAPAAPPGTATSGAAADAGPQAAVADAPLPSAPETLPELTLPDPKGQPRSLKDYLGHPLIVNFWATWCGPCRREIPLLQQLRQTYSGRGLEVVGVAVDFQAAVAEYLQKNPIAYPLMIGEDQGLAAAEKFGMEPVLPFSVFADAKGRILAVKVGELHQNEADYILSTMQQLESGKKSLQEARAGITDRLRAFAVERAKAGGKES